MTPCRAPDARLRNADPTSIPTHPPVLRLPSSMGCSVRGPAPAPRSRLSSTVMLRPTWAGMSHPLHHTTRRMPLHKSPSLEAKLILSQCLEYQAANASKVNRNGHHPVKRAVFDIQADLRRKRLRLGCAWMAAFPRSVLTRVIRWSRDGQSFPFRLNKLTHFF